MNTFLRSTGSWTMGGSGYEKVWGRGPFLIYRRTEDQKWSPYHVERRTEYGFRIGKFFDIAVVTSSNFFRKVEKK